MSNRPRPSQTPPQRPPTRRQVAAQQRETNLQRRVILVLGGVVGLALLLIVAGFVVDRLVLPSRTLRQVNSATLTRNEYERLQRMTLIQQMAQTLQFSKLFGANQSFGQSGRFDEQIVSANFQLNELGTSRARQQPIDETLISQWVDDQVTTQAAQQQFGVEPAQGEVDQLIVRQYSSVLESTEALTDTAPITATAETSPEASAAATAEATPTAAPPTATPEPTATPLPDEATAQVDQILDQLYTEYTNILGALPEEAAARQRTPHATREDFATALRVQFRTELIRQRVGEALVPEVPADDASTPDQISARHILLQVPAPTPTPEPDAESTAEPATAETPGPTEAEPTPTPSPEELEQLFAERKAEADELYQQLQANPESFPDIAAEFSEDEGSAADGGNVGTFDRSGQTQTGATLVQPFTDAAWALEENEISEPVRTDFGWHIIQRLPEDPEAKLQRLRTAAFEAWIEEQRATAEILPAPTPTPTEIPPVEVEEPSAAPESSPAP